MPYRNVRIADSEGCYLYDTDGNQYYDLNMGYGSVVLGHSCPAVIEAVNLQVRKYSSPGFLLSSVFDDVSIKLEKFFTASYYLHGLYPSGALAVEFALRYAMESRNGGAIVSFDRNMHGKTLGTSQLGSENKYCNIENIIRLQHDGIAESDLLDQYYSLISTRRIACLVVEPIQMTGGGKTLSDSFFQQIVKISRDNEILVIFDEILTGCFRTGYKFFYEKLKILPDVVVVGKALGNGYPVAGVMLKEGFEVSQRMSPGGTYFNNPLACSAVLATLEQFDMLDISEKVSAIESTVTELLPKEHLRGMGALWTIKLENDRHTSDIVRKLAKENIVVSYYDQYIRLLPAYLADIGDLRLACSVMARSI